jgi:hypothetical protein
MVVVVGQRAVQLTVIVKSDKAVVVVKVVAGIGKLSVIDLYKIEPVGRGDGAALDAVFRR